MSYQFLPINRERSEDGDALIPTSRIKWDKKFGFAIVGCSSAVVLVIVTTTALVYPIFAFWCLQRGQCAVVSFGRITYRINQFRAHFDSIEWGYCRILAKHVIVGTVDPDHKD